LRAKGLHPVAVVVGTLAEHLFADDRNFQDLSKEMDHLFGPRQPAEVAVNHNAVEAMVYKNQQAGKQLCEQLHRSSPGSRLSNKIIGQTTGGVKISNLFGKFSLNEISLHMCSECTTRTQCAKIAQFN
jgi:hypothetical protein